MSYLTDGLTFNTLRQANRDRLPQFKNKKGEPAHTKEDGSDWSLPEWMNAVAGEVGEAANIIKKIRRGDITLEEARESLAEEFADIVTYLDLTAMQAGINLGAAIMGKFNKKSKEVGSSIHIDAEGVHNLTLQPRAEETNDDASGIAKLNLPEEYGENVSQFLADCRAIGVDNLKEDRKELYNHFNSKV